MTTMSIDEIFEQFVVSPNGFPFEAVAAAEQQREEITEELLQLLDDVVMDPDLFFEEFSHIFALFLLAKFREPRAYARIVNLAIMPSDEIDALLGDSITEDLPRWLASVANGDLTQIDRLIRDKNASGYARGSGIRAISVMIVNGLLDRGVAISYLRTLFHELDRDVKYETVWTDLVMVAAELSAVELADEVEQVFDDNLFDFFMAEHEAIDAELHTDLAENLARMSKSTLYHLIDDVAKEISWWHVWKPPAPPKPTPEPRKALDFQGQSPSRKALAVEPRRASEFSGDQPGRNAPCPCGSGKKYKKCHGKKG